jgi:hypothetical protein
MIRIEGPIPVDDSVDQTWFEMPEVRRRTLASAVWIPLRANTRLKENGIDGHAGYELEYYGVGTLAVPIEFKAKCEKLTWRDVGIRHQHSGYVQDGKYISADEYHDPGGDFSGLYLVLEQCGNSAEISEWHLHQDFVVTLGLKREADIWIRPDEGYIEVAKLFRREDSSPCLLEIRGSHLRDYLCARGMVLYVTSYRERVKVIDDAGHISWPENPMRESDEHNRWEGRVLAIHEGGMPYGQKAAVLHIVRTDVDPDDDVPVLGPLRDENVISNRWTKEHIGKKVYRVDGALWRSEWIEPASQSPIVRGDKVPPTVFFVTDAKGKQENRETLVAEGRWLWFRPEVISVLAHRRGGGLRWFTRDTGLVGCSPDYGVRFGVNSLGLINVYAKDIALLPEWQQKVWSGCNVSPDGKVSEELLASQIKADPAKTRAPEALLTDGLSRFKHLAKSKLQMAIVREHDQIANLIARVHRFRATDKAGLLALAKDLARLTADSIDVSALQKFVVPPKGRQWGSLKSLENLLATRIDPSRARAIMTPLVGIYELRHADAHLPGREIDEAFSMVKVDQNAPFVTQGCQLLNACVSSLCDICEVLEKWSGQDEPSGL